MNKQVKTVQVDGKEIRVGDCVGFKCDTEQYAAIESIRKSYGAVFFTVTATEYDEEEEYEIGSGPVEVNAKDCWYE